MDERSKKAEDFDLPTLSVESDPAMDGALDFLRSASLDPAPIRISRMEVNVLRQWRHERNLRSWKWWMPFAAALAVGFFLAALCLNLLQPLFNPGADQDTAVAWPEFKAESSQASKP